MVDKIEQTPVQQERYSQQIKNNREELEKLVKDLEDLASKSKSLIPEDLSDFRNKFIATQRIDTVTKLYTTILQYRSEINKQLKDEWQINSKESGDNDEIESLIKYIAETPLRK
jgi:DNA repair exonuclease SbcCD ATPase subunit